MTDLRSRSIRIAPAAVALLSVEAVPDARAWLEARAAEHGPFAFLLAHVDDGVVWGRFDGPRLVTSREAAGSDAEALAACPPLRADTLQQARLFSAAAELLLWRDGDGTWNARLVRDVGAGGDAHLRDALDEPYMLWGTDPRSLAHGFTLMRDGEQGLRHAVPITHQTDGGGLSTPLYLQVRHYLQDDPATGFTHIVLSRLVEVRS